MPSEKDKFSARLNEVLDDIGFAKIGHGRQSSLAKLLSVSPRQAGSWLRGESFPKTSQLVKLSQFMNVRSNWLLSGVGGKHPSEREQDRIPNGDPDLSEGNNPDESVEGNASLLSNDAFNIALAWMKLPMSQRVALQKVIVELGQDR